MFRLIVLFSFFVPLFGFSQIKKEFDLEVEIVAIEVQQKPKLNPPEKLPMEEPKPLDLSSELLQPPKEMEFLPVLPIRQEGLSCGAPKDAVAYKKGVDHYLAGRFIQAEQELSSIFVMPSPYRPMAEYVLGLIKLRQGQKVQALNLFESSCRYTHIYTQASCELFYALSFEVKGEIPENQHQFWSLVRTIKSSGQYKAPNCEGTIFKRYCVYVESFVKGRIDNEYEDSTKIRRAIVLFESGQLAEAEKTLADYSKPGKPYRDIALYYLGLIALQKGQLELAYRSASLLETINSRYAHSLYSHIASKSILFARLTYSITKDPRFLNIAGTIAYNNKDYQLASSNFLEAKNTKYAVYALIKKGDYTTAYRILKEKKERDREDYLWLLESAYWADLPMEEMLEAIKEKYPQMYKEYLGWSLFKRGDWSSALKYFDNPEYKALCYYNLKKYQEVIKVLRGISSQRANVLKAKSALFLNNPSLARTFLSENSDEELYLLGISYFMEGNYPKAIEYFKRVYNSPFGPMARMKTADALYNLGRVEEAKATYWEILKNFPESPVASQATLALLEIDTNLPDSKKEELIREYLKRNPDSPYANELKYQLADILIARGEGKEAQKLLLELYEKDNNLKYRALLKLADIQENKNDKLVILYKVYKEGPEEESAQARRKLINIYTEIGDKLSAAELLEVGSIQEKERAIELYTELNQWQRALRLSQELMHLGYRSTAFENSLMKVYKNTKDGSLLDYLINSYDANLSAQAKFEKAILLREQSRHREALEYLVDISINHKGASVYNQAIMEGTRIFLDLGLRRDASCFLERFDLNSASKEDTIRYEQLKRILPKCEVR